MKPGIVVVGLLIILLGSVVAVGAIPLPASTVSGSGDSLTVTCTTSQCNVTYTVHNPSNAYQYEYEVSLCIYPSSVTAPSYATCLYTAIYFVRFTPILNAGASTTHTFVVPVSGTFASAGNYWMTLCQAQAGSTCDTAGLVLEFSVPVSTVTTVTTISNPTTTYVSTVTSTTFSTTSQQTTGSGQFSIISPVPIGNVNPVGTSVTSTCPSPTEGPYCYTAVWTPGTSISITASFTAAYNVCWQYDTGGTCTPVVSGLSFVITSEAYPHYAILLETASTSQSVNIVACAAAPNPCVSSNAEGSWNPAAATLSPSVTVATFTFTPASGYSCSGNWYLWSTQANAVVSSGSGATSSVSFTWVQVEGYEATFGTSLDLVFGTTTGTTCTAQTSTLTVGWSPYITDVACSGGPFDGNTVLCPASTTINGPGTVTLSEVCESSCQFNGWTVNGASYGNAQSITIDVTATQAWTVYASASAAPTTTTTTGATSSSPGSTTHLSSNAIVGGVTIGAGLIVTMLGFAMRSGPVASTTRRTKR